MRDPSAPEHSREVGDINDEKEFSNKACDIPTGIACFGVELILFIVMMMMMMIDVLRPLLCTR